MLKLSVASTEKDLSDSNDILRNYGTDLGSSDREM